MMKGQEREKAVKNPKQGQNNVGVVKNKTKNVKCSTVARSRSENL